VSQDTDSNFLFSPILGVPCHGNKTIPQATEVVLQFRKSISCVEIGNYLETLESHGSNGEPVILRIEFHHAATDVDAIDE
jgi:hypothetical protein